MMTYNWEQAAASTLANGGADSAEVVEVLGVPWCCKRKKKVSKWWMCLCIDVRLGEEVLRGAQSKLAIPRMSVAQHCGLARALVQGSNVLWRSSRAASSTGMAVAMEMVAPTRAAMMTEKRILAVGLGFLKT